VVLPVSAVLMVVASLRQPDFLPQGEEKSMNLPSPFWCMEFQIVSHMNGIVVYVVMFNACRFESDSGCNLLHHKLTTEGKIIWE